MKFALLLGLFFLFVAPKSGYGQLDEEAIGKLSQEVSDTTMSPYCPGRTLSACPSPQARELRTQISAWFHQGYSVEGVRNQLLTIYGPEVRGAPAFSGIGILAWIFPIVAIFLGVVLVVVRLRRLRLVEGSMIPPLDQAAIKQVEQELKNRFIS